MGEVDENAVIGQPEPLPAETLTAGRNAALVSVKDIADDIAAGHHMEPGWLPKALQTVADDVLGAATPHVAAAERERLFVAIRHALPLSAPWRGEALDLIAKVWEEL